MAKKYYLIILFVLVILAGGVRLYHFDFGIPRWNLYDEKRAIRQTMRFFHGNYLVRTLNHPPLIKYCALVLLKSYNFINPIEKKDLYRLTNKSLRLVSVIAGTLAVLALYLLAREFLNPQMSLIIVGLYAFLPITVFISKQGIPDTLLSLMFIINFYLIIKLYKKKTLLLYALNGLFLSLATASKYNAVFLFASFLTAHFFAAKEQKHFWKFLFGWKKISLFLAAALLGLSIGFPTVLCGNEFNNFISSLLFEKKHLFGARDGALHRGSNYFYLFHFIKSIFPVTGFPLLLFITAGILYIFKRHSKLDIIILITFVPYYLIIERVFKILVAPDRYVLPIVSLYILFSIIFLYKLVEYLNNKFKIRKDLLTVILTIFIAFYPIVKTTNLLICFVPDTRDITAGWINKNIAPKSVFFYPLKFFDYYPVLSVKKYTFKLLNYMNTRYKQIEKNNIDYVIITDLGYKNVHRVKKLYKELQDNAELVYVIKPKYESYLQNNPTIKIFKIPKK